MKLVVFSSDDLAGRNMAVLLEGMGLRRGVDLVEVDDNLKGKSSLPYAPEVCIVASRHKSESGQPTLTCHATGNYGKANMGGISGHLQLTNALYLSKAILLLKEKQKQYNLSYEVSLEVTHHGPTELSFPLIYVEVGSSEEQWNDMTACKAVAEVVYELYYHEPKKLPVGIGFGGPHYAPNFTEAAANVALGHIAPKHAMDFVDKAMVVQMLDKTLPKPELAVLDWKGLKSEEKQRITGILTELNVPWKKTSELKV